MHLIFNLSAICRIRLIPVYCGFFSSALNGTNERRNQEKKVHISTRNLVLRLYCNCSFLTVKACGHKVHWGALWGFTIIFAPVRWLDPMLLTRRLHYFYLPTNKNSALEKTKQEKKNPMWELALSQASFHSFVKSNIDLQMTRMESIPWCRGGDQGTGLLLLTICLSCIAPPLPVASRTCDLEAKQIIIIIIKKKS